MTVTTPAPAKIRRRAGTPASATVNTFAASGDRGKSRQINSSLTLAELDRYVQDWLLDGEARLSKKTVADRRHITDKLRWWLKHTGATECDRAALARFFAYLPRAHETEGGRWGQMQAGANTPARNKTRAAKPLSPTSCANYFRWLRTFFLYLVACGMLDESPMRTLRPAAHRDDQVQPFSPEQQEALLVAASKTVNAARNVAVLLFLLDTGARAGELCGLKMAEINFGERSVRVTGKGDKARTLFLSPQTSRAILDYLRGEQRAPTDYVFQSERGDGSPLTVQSLYQMFKTAGAAAGLSGVRCSPHTCRHTFAIEFLRRGGDPVTLQVMYGHTDLAQTRRYLAVAGADCKKAHARFSPVLDLRGARIRAGSKKKG